MGIDSFEKFAARLEKTSISMLNYNKLFKLLTYGDSEEFYLSAEEIAEHWKVLRKRHDEKILKLVLYFPYCAQKCLYCREKSEKLKNCEEVENFLVDAEKEMKYFSKIFHGKEIDYFTFNGGSPDILNPAQLDLILNSLFSKFKFKRGAVIRLELNPTGISAEKLKIVKKFGFNRISFGVQSLSKRALSNAGRPYVQYAMLAEIIALTRKAGFGDINMDLILGLPGESYLQFENGLRKLCELKPAQIIVYILNEPNARYLDKFPEMNIVDFQKRIENMVSKFLRSDFLDEIGKMGYVLVPDKNNMNYKYFTLVRSDISALSWLNNMDNYINISTCVIGEKDTSGIFSDLIYERISNFNEKDKIYSASSVSQDHEMKKFIFSSVESSRQIKRDLFQDVFKADIKEKFGVAIKVLQEKKRIRMENEIIYFLSKNSKDIIIDLAFFISNMK